MLYLPYSLKKDDKEKECTYNTFSFLSVLESPYFFALLAGDLLYLDDNSDAPCTWHSSLENPQHRIPLCSTGTTM